MSYRQLVTRYWILAISISCDCECNRDFSPTNEGGGALRRIVRSGSKAVASACRSYGCTMNTLLLVSVPFVVVTVIGPVVAESGTVARM